MLVDVCILSATWRRHVWNILNNPHKLLLVLCLANEKLWIELDSQKLIFLGRLEFTEMLSCLLFYTAHQ